MTQKPVQLSVASYFYRVGNPIERTNEILVESWYVKKCAKIHRRTAKKAKSIKIQ